jgi:mannose-6-phosphate isomerase
MRATRSSVRARSWSGDEPLSVDSRMTADAESQADSRSAVPAPHPSELPRRVDKPWGHELIWAHTDRYVGKILEIETGKRLSLQHHEVKDEWIHVLDGRLLLTLQKDDGTIEDRELAAGESAHVPTGRRHRYTAIETCRIVEISTPELLDVVRIEDDFGREGTFMP